jgi:hypothetical protein
VNRQSQLLQSMRSAQVEGVFNLAHGTLGSALDDLRRMLFSPNVCSNDSSRR